MSGKCVRICLWMSHSSGGKCLEVPYVSRRRCLSLSNGENLSPSLVMGCFILAFVFYPWFSSGSCGARHGLGLSFEPIFCSLAKGKIRVSEKRFHHVQIKLTISKVKIILSLIEPCFSSIGSFFCKIISHNLYFGRPALLECFSLGSFLQCGARSLILIGQTSFLFPFQGIRH